MRKRFLCMALLLSFLMMVLSGCSLLSENGGSSGDSFSLNGIVDSLGLDKVADVVDSFLDKEEEAPPLDEAFYPYYASLSDEDKLVYYEILQGLEAGLDCIQLSHKVSQDRVSEIAQFICYDQPQLFWFDGSMAYTYDQTTNKVLEINPSYNDLADDLEGNKAKVEEAANAVLKKIADKKKPEAEKYCHDYLAKKTKYQAGKYDQTIYSALVQKKTVCAGYTRAMQYLMIQRGIPCYYCSGTSYDSETESWELHSWNIIKLKGGYYNLDLTWDDSRGEKDKYPSAILYHYYNVTDKKLSKDHKRDEICELLPECDATERSYKNYYGHSWISDLDEQLSLDSSKPITSMEKYYKLCRHIFEKNGKGSYTIAYAVKGTKIMKQIAAVDKEAWEENVISEVKEVLGLSSLRYSFNLKYWELGNQSGCYYVEQDISLEDY